MKINKALVKHETRNMKWMLLYFILVAIGGVMFFNTVLNGQYASFLSGMLINSESVILSAVNQLANMIALPIGLGILLMIFLQFKDSKSVEVGNFLKALPISNREYFVTKLIGGIVALTIPTLILIIGVIFIRNGNMNWINDVNSASIVVDFIVKSGSIINITTILILCYLVSISTYTFLFMIQYIITNITSGLVIGSLVWLSPLFLIGSIGVIYGRVIEKIIPSDGVLIKTAEKAYEYIQPWFYPSSMKYQDGLGEMYQGVGMNIQFVYYEGLILKIGITLLISILSITVGYVLSKKSKVEDSDEFIIFKWARVVFVIGVTVCSALLLTVIPQIFIGVYGSISFIVLQIIMLVGAILGFVVSKRLIRVRNK